MWCESKITALIEILNKIVIEMSNIKGEKIHDAVIKINNKIFLYLYIYTFIFFKFKDYIFKFK